MCRTRMLASDTPRVISISGMLTPPSRLTVLASQRGNSRSSIITASAAHRLRMIGLISSLRQERSAPERIMPRVKWPTESIRKNATASASPASPKAYRLIGRPMLPVLGNR
ncbi:hypothetical protein D3C72_2174320 [compost metagenome]